MKMARIHGNTEVNTVLWRWFSTARANGYPLSGPIVQGKAVQIADNFDPNHTFKASNGWLDKWKKRYEIKDFKISLSLVMLIWKWLMNGKRD